MILCVVMLGGICGTVGENVQVMAEGKYVVINGVVWGYHENDETGYNINPANRYGRYGELNQDTFIGTINIPNEIDGKPVTSMSDASFASLTKIEEVIIPPNLEKLGIGAFKYCSALKKITLLDGRKSIQIPSQAFKECTALTTLEIKVSGTVTIADNAFEGCTALDSIHIIGEQVNIAKEAFKNCGSIDNINIKATEIQIGESTFLSSQNLKEVNIDGSNTMIGDMAFAECTNLETLKLGNCDSIGNEAFSNCTGLKNLALDVKKIGKKAFQKCKNLKSILFQNEVMIEEEAFVNSFDLTGESKEVVFQENAILKGGTFSGCSGLESVIFCKDVTMGTKDATYDFSNTGIKNITFQGKTVLSSNSIRNCANLQKIVFQGNTTLADGAISTLSKLESVTFEGTENQLGMTTSPFINCTGLKNMYFYNAISIKGIINQYDNQKDESSNITGGGYLPSLTKLVFWCPNAKMDLVDTSTNPYKIYGFFQENKTSEVEKFIEKSRALNKNIDAINIVRNLKVEPVNNSYIVTGEKKWSEADFKVTADYSCDEDKTKMENKTVSFAKDANEVTGYLISQPTVEENIITLYIKHSGISVPVQFTQEEIVIPTPTVTVTATPIPTPMVVVAETPVPTQTAEVGKSPVVSTPEVMKTELPTSTSIVTETPIIPTSVATETPSITKIPDGTIKPLETHIPTTAPTLEPHIPTLEPIKTVTPKAIKIPIKNTKILLEKSTYYTKNKKEVKPKVVVQYKNERLVLKKDYTLQYKKNQNYGKASVVISGKGNYTGKKEITFYILPEKTIITKSKTYSYKNGKVVKVHWKKQQGVSGYQIVYAKTRRGKYKEATRKGAKITSTVFSLSNKKIYMKMRAYIIVNGKYKYGAYSKVKEIKVN